MNYAEKAGNFLNIGLQSIFKSLFKIFLSNMI